MSARSSGLRLAGPRVGNLAPAGEIVHDQDQLMVVVAVQNLDVDARLGHPARQQAELTGQVLLQSLNQHFPLGENLNAGRFQRPAGARSVGKEKMGHALPGHDPGPSTFDAHARAAQSLAHLGEGARSVRQGDRQVLRGRRHLRKSVTSLMVAVGFSSMIQWPDWGTTPSVTLVAAARMTVAIIGPNDFSPPSASTGIVSLP